LEDNTKNKCCTWSKDDRRRKSLLILIPSAIAVIGGFDGLTVMFVSSNASQMLLHDHVRLNITSDGQPLTIPAHIGMAQLGKAEDPQLYGNHSLDSYGMEGMSPLHTHDPSGTIHVESNQERNFTLSDFLDIWLGLNLDGKDIDVKVDGKPVADYQSILLHDNQTIMMEMRS
jgi:hypothetical protein